MNTKHLLQSPNILLALKELNFQMVNMDSNLISELDEDFLYEDSVNLPVLKTYEDGDRDYNYDFHQCYITDLCTAEINYLAKKYDLSFSYHKVLQKWFLLEYKNID